MKISLLALGLLGVAYAFSIVAQFQSRTRTEPPGYATIHISHRYLESGYREALDVVIKDFEAYQLRQGVKAKVVQHAIPRRYYDQWLTTNLASRTAPDIIEMNPNWNRINYLLQNFVSLDSLIGRPNPFNDLNRIAEEFGDVDLHRNLTAAQRKADTRLRKPFYIRDLNTQVEDELRKFLRETPIKDSYLDGMIGGFNYRLGSYYSFPTSSATSRIFYNKDLVRKAGYESPPQILHEFFALCENLQALQAPTGKPIIPIAAYRETASAQMELIETRYAAPFTYRDSFARDWELTGNPRDYYIFAEWQRGNWSFETPSAKSYYQLARKLASYSTPGFLAIERDQATFSFMQGHAAMIVSTALDASHFFRNAEFEVGVMGYPMPGPKDPQSWSQFADMPARESSGVSGLFGLNSRSQHPELARAFIEFLTSYIWNERFNHYAQLVPSVAGASIPEALEPFKQNVQGIHAINIFLPLSSNDNPYIESDYRGEFWIYLSRQIEDDDDAYASFVQAIERRFNDPVYGVDRIWSNKLINSRRESRMQDRLLNTKRAAQLLRDEATIAYDREMATSILRNADENNGTNILLEFRQLFHETGKEFPSH